MKELVFTVESAKGKKVNKAACPGSGNRGTVKLELPDAAGPFDITAVAAGLPKSRSEHVKGAAPKDVVHLRIYAAGCDSESCK